jgi:hypothetical protein
MVKKLTRDQLQSRKEKAADFAANVLEDPDLADEIEAETLEEYAAHKRIEIINPMRRKHTMARTRNPKVKDELEEAEDTLQEVANLVSEALDPELSREEVVGKLKEIEDALPFEAEGEEEPEPTE